MHHGIDLVLLQEPPDRVPVADLADNQRGIEDRLAEAAREVIEHHHPLAARPQLQDHVGADVAGAPGD